MNTLSITLYEIGEDSQKIQKHNQKTVLSELIEGITHLNRMPPLFQKSQALESL